MGINNRDYIRDSNDRFGGGSWDAGGISPTVRYLLIANAVVYLLQILLLRPVPPQEIGSHPPHTEVMPLAYRQADFQFAPRADNTALRSQTGWRGLRRSRNRFPPRESLVQSWFELDTRKVLQGQVWRLITCAFCHSRGSVLHIVFNMLVLWWFGRTLEAMYGSREFLLFYLAAAVASSLAFVALDLYAGRTVPAIGASGAVWGVMILFCMHYPRYQVRVYFLFPIEMRFLLALYAIYDLHPVLRILSGENTVTGVAHSAHLGGLLFGILYNYFGLRLEALSDGFWHRTQFLKRRIARREIRLHMPEDGVKNGKPSVETPELDNELDNVLRKISSEGRASLSAEEEALLAAASKRLGQSRHEKHL